MPVWTFVSDAGSDGAVIMQTAMTSDDETGALTGAVSFRGST